MFGVRTKQRKCSQLFYGYGDGLARSVFARQSRALQLPPKQQATLHRITVKTLIECVEYDNAMPLWKHEMMFKLIPEVSSQVIKWAEYFLILEQPLTTSDALKRWLSTYEDLPIDGRVILESKSIYS